MLKPHVYKTKDLAKIEAWKKKSLSHSQIASWEYNKEQWYQSYVDPAIFVSSPETTFGSMIDKRFQTDPTFIPHIKRYEYLQYKMRADFDGISLVGIPDNLQITGDKKLEDLKTGRVPWTQKKAEDTGQLKMYLLLLYLTGKHKPEDFECGIVWLPTEKDEDDKVTLVEPLEVKIFPVKHDMRAILKYGQYIKEVYKEMCEYVDNHI